MERKEHHEVKGQVVQESKEHSMIHQPVSPRNTTLWVMAIALGLLIVIAGVQAIEMVSLKNKLANDITALGAASKPSVSSGGLSKSLESLPSMVGGC